MLFSCFCHLCKKKKIHDHIVVFFEVKCHRRHLFNKVFSVLGANKNPTRISKYGGSVPGTCTPRTKEEGEQTPHFLDVINYLNSPNEKSRI